MARPRQETVRQRAAFAQIRKAEVGYGAQLRKVARHIGDMVRAFPDGGPELQQILREYSTTLAPWARAVAKRMLGDVARRDKAAWRRHAKLMGQELRREVLEAPTGLVMQNFLAEQVHLITSLPLDAAERVHRMTLQAQRSGTRAKEIAEEILQSGEVSKGRAMLIARTEVSRTAAALTMARADAVGSTHYIWRTAGDQSVRTLHRKLNGKVIAWNAPPIAGEDGERAHAGMIYNCRCFPDPILPD